MLCSIGLLLVHGVEYNYGYLQVQTLWRVSELCMHLLGKVMRPHALVI